MPTTNQPTTFMPTTSIPTTLAPTTYNPTIIPTTSLTTNTPTKMPIASTQSLVSIYSTFQSTVTETNNPPPIIIEFNIEISNQTDIQDVIQILNETIKEYLIAQTGEYQLNFDVISMTNTSIQTVQVTVNGLDNEYIINEKDLVDLTRINLKNDQGTNVILIDVKVTDNRVNEKIDFIETQYRYIIIGITAFFVCIIISSLVYGKCYKKTDFYLFENILLVAFHLLDTISDIIFTLQIQYHYSLTNDTILLYLFIASVIFILLPIIVSILQLNREINQKWVKSSCDSDVLTVWCRTHQTWLIYLSIFCGSSFAAIQMAKSHFFGLKYFQMPLPTIPYLKFMTKRIYSINIMENIPQIVIQVLYIYFTTKQKLTDPVVYMSMIFSLLSIIGGILAMCSQKNILKIEEYTHIEFDVVGDGVSNANANKVNDIKYKIAKLLSIQQELVEMCLPIEIDDGFKIAMNIFIRNKKSNEMDIENRLKQANDNNKISKIITQSWKLSNPPTIRNIQINLIQSLYEIRLLKQISGGKDKIRSNSESYHEVEMNIINV
eukprot:363692_1